MPTTRKSTKKTTMGDEQPQPPRTTAPPVNLRFVVANDPEQFRDRSTMRSNRSHVMHNHLSEKRHGEASKAQAVEGSRVRKATRSTTPSRTASRTGSPALSNASLEQSSTEQTLSSSEALAIYRRTQDPKPRRRTTAASSEGLLRSNTGGSSRSGSVPLGSPGLRSRPGSVPLLTATPSAIPSPQLSGLLNCENEDYAATLNQALIQWRTQSGAGWGFPMMSQELSVRPKITIDILRYYCLDVIRSTGSAFTTARPYRASSWIQLMGAITLAASELAVADGPLSDAANGTNAEALEILQRGFQDSTGGITDMTAMAVLFLVARAILNLEDNLVQVHEQGLLRILQLRSQGGLSAICSQLENAVLSLVSLSAVTTERQIDNGWAEYREATDRSATRTSQPGLHSPLLFPTTGFGLLFDPNACQERTHIVLRSACQMTNLACKVASMRNTQVFAPGFSTGGESVQRLTALTRSIGETASSIEALNRSAHDEDYVFESCRIAAMIYATSIQRKMFFQQAADVIQEEGMHLDPVQSLVYALQHTDIAGCWDNMCGVLLWISLIGGTAARDPQARSWLLGITMRCCIVLLVERGDAVVESLKTLLTVTSLWVDGGSSAFA